MIEEVISEIKIAEAESESKLKDAYAEGKQIVLDAELKAEEQKKSTALACKADLRAAVAEAEKRADKEHGRLAADGEKAANDFAAKKDKEIDGKAEEILNLLLKKYGCGK